MDYHHVIMARTTVNIDAPILAELKRLQQREGKTLGRLISDLLAAAIVRHEAKGPPAPFAWAVSPGRLLTDPLDKETIYAILDRERAAEGDDS